MPKIKKIFLKYLKKVIFFPSPSFVEQFQQNSRLNATFYVQELVI